MILLSELRVLSSLFLTNESYCDICFNKKVIPELMALSIFSNFATLLPWIVVLYISCVTTKYLKECTLGVEKYVRNVVDDVVSY